MSDHDYATCRIQDCDECKYISESSDASARIIETFNRNLIETGALGARRAASKEIARMAKIESRILQSMAKLRLEREHILQMCGELGNPRGLELAALELQMVIDRLDEERLKHHA